MEADMKQRGYTILEIVIAVSILSLGSAVLWYTLRSAAHADRINRLHHFAVAAAQSDLESLHGRSRRNIQDTAYSVKTGAGDDLRLVRVVFDSAKIVASMTEITLDENLTPKELQKPLEVRVSVYKVATEGETPAEEGGAGFSLENFSETQADTGKYGKPLVTLTDKLPDYQWY
jgi:prepilin-type N-terminal cleavage/methylation domain-containing protein